MTENKPSFLVIIYHDAGGTLLYFNTKTMAVSVAKRTITATNVISVKLFDKNTLLKEFAK